MRTFFKSFERRAGELAMGYPQIRALFMIIGVFSQFHKSRHNSFQITCPLILYDIRKLQCLLLTLQVPLAFSDYIVEHAVSDCMLEIL